MAFRHQNRWVTMSFVLLLAAASGCSRYVNTLEGSSPLAGAYVFEWCRFVEWCDGEHDPHVTEWSDLDYLSTEDGIVRGIPAAILREDGSFDLRAGGALSLFASAFTELTVNLRQPGDRAYLSSEDATSRDYIEVLHCRFAPNTSQMEFAGHGGVRCDLVRSLKISAIRLDDDRLRYRLVRTVDAGRQQMTGTLVRLPRERWLFDFLADWPPEGPPECDDADATGS